MFVTAFTITYDMYFCLFPVRQCLQTLFMAIYMIDFIQTGINPLAPELFFKFLHTLYFKCE
jgi:hypothetical protein